MALTEQPIYGAGRIGVAYNNGQTVYELTDHLGNVRAVFTKENVDNGPEGYTDYYPGGMPMPSRTLKGAEGYRYGYQGQYAETDPETGKPTFELRLYDPRILRWLTTDPYGQFHSPYLAMGNNWVNFTDPDGGYCPDCPGPGDTAAAGYSSGDTYQSSDGNTYTLLDGDFGWSSAPGVTVTEYNSSPQARHRINVTLGIMSDMVNENIPYSQLGDRTNLTGDGPCGLDCSETVSIYLKLLNVMDDDLISLHTGVMTNQDDFRSAMGSNNIVHLPESTNIDFVPKPGDIFVWRTRGVGHTGIVSQVDGNKATILEAIGNVGSADERFNRNNGGTALRGVSRTAVYRLNGRALARHSGWYGYFRPTLR